MRELIDVRWPSGLDASHNTGVLFSARESVVDFSTGGSTLNHMVQLSPVVLDRTFSALADAHRRQILDRLAEGPVSISDLAAPLGMSLPGVLKHVRALEAAQLVETLKRGRTRWCRLGDRPLDAVAAWMDERRTRWDQRLDRFERYVDDLDGT